MNETILDPSNINLLMEEISKQSNGSGVAGDIHKVEDANFIQLTICEIWSKMLGSSSFNLTDDLFDVGGDSVTAIQIFSEINKTFGIRLSMEELFNADTFSVTWLSELVERYLIDLLGMEEFVALVSEVKGLPEIDKQEYSGA